MNYFFDFTPLTQQPDSVQTDTPLIQSEYQGFMEQKSIMSAEFNNNSIDSLVKIKTQTRRVRKKKIIKAYKVFDSFLMVKKEPFLCLKSSQKPESSIVKFYLEVKHIKPKTTKETSGRTQQQQDRELTIKKERLSTTNTITVEDNKVNEVQKFNNPDLVLSGELWLIGVLLLSLTLFVFIKKLFGDKLKIYAKSLLGYQFLNKMFREQNIVNQRFAALLSALFYINTSLLLYYTALHISQSLFGFFGFGYYFEMLLFLLLSVLSFTIINKLLEFIFEVYDIINEYLYTVYYFHRVLGVFLLPVVIFYPYLPSIIAQPLLYLGWSIVLLLFIFRWFRGVQISFKHRISFLYMILYLCALEIIPLMFISKIILKVY